MNTIPFGATPYVLYTTIVAATYLEHFSEKENSLGRQLVDELKNRYGTPAYPGGSKEIDETVSSHRDMVREIIAKVQEGTVGLKYIEDVVLLMCPAIYMRDTNSLAARISLVAEHNAHRQDIEAFRKRGIRYTG